MAKAKVENIQPLSYNQKILLFHHLSTDEDSGIIQVKCTLEGVINKKAFTVAWAAVVEKYDVLRTSIQWENLSKQLQVVQEHAELDIEWVDLKGDNSQADFIKNYESEDREKSFSLNMAPVSRVTVFQLNEHQYQLLWTCHHILLDGWSSRLVLQDVFRIYDLAINGEDLNTDTSVPSMIDYLKAVDKLSQHEEVKLFWKKVIDDKLFSDRFFELHVENQTADNFNVIEASLPGIELSDFAKEHRLTLTSLLQTAWLLTIKWFRQNNLVATGTVVSGRAFDFPGIEKLAGLLSNVLPVIHQFQPDQSFIEAAKQVQQHHAKARKYQSINIDQIKEWCHWKGNPNLFDTLLVIENFAQDEITSQYLNIQNYESGLTTTYPITMAVVPGESIKMHCVWNSSVIERDLANQLLNTFQEILKTKRELTIDQISQALGEPPVTNINKYSEQKHTQNFEIASTLTELELTKIWARVLGLKVIGTTDNFFALGGKSIQAIQLFREIENSFDKILLPSVLLQHPTINQLAKLINDDREIEFKCIVPLKPSGKKPPLFCIHAGGSHVFLYKKLAESIGLNYPVYAIQPKGLDGGEMHHSIEEMAQDYLKEILSITNQQKFYLLGYCFSTIVCLEVARIANEKNLEIELVIIDGATFPWWHRNRLIGRNDSRILNFGKIILTADLQGIASTILLRIDRIKAKVRFNSDKQLDKEKVESKSDTELYLEKMSHNMDILINQYDYNPVKTNVHLIRSSHFVNRDDKNFVIDIWEVLSKHSLKTYQVDGHHRTILEGQSAVDMARTIERIIGHESK